MRSWNNLNNIRRYINAYTKSVTGVSPGYVAIVATPLTLITLVRSLRTSMMTIEKVCRLAGEPCASNMYTLVLSPSFSLVLPV